MTTPIQTAAARLTALVEAGLADSSVARPAIACAAVELMDCAARPSEGDDPAVVYLADQFVERTALWAYGQRYRDFRRADDEMKLRTPSGPIEMVSSFDVGARCRTNRCGRKDCGALRVQPRYRAVALPSVTTAGEVEISPRTQYPPW